ncbi:ester cyclase [Mycolicibacterium wolinskyi]|uniref:ester cyclase n=1 Tax=Mycolicibacterium TaxID=1866885 RepID=UPI000A15587B|nr:MULTISPECIES: ester cyclase [Mycolicibacterium]MCV7284113.1 ester cyclase [Mycolicibacterium wolinskyi]MCV7293949.1 ester cyclase [Mycolicibacterium goodii]
MSIEASTAGIYRRYLECLNDRRWDDLGEFVCADVIHNGNSLGLSGYREMLESDVAAIPDLRFDADLIVVQDDLLAGRLLFQCTPQREFLGFQPSGTRVSFTEHVFYRFRDAKIAQVWSAIDTRTVAAQIAR